MKRTGFRPPTEEQVRRARQRKQEAAARYQEKRKAKARQAPRERKKRKRIRPRNPERAARLFVRNYHSDAFVGWIHSLACAVSGGEGSEADPIVAAHVRGKGAGGDWTMVIPMLQSLHDELHRIGHRTFQRRHGVDLELVAAAVHQRWRQFAGEQGIPWEAAA